MPDHDDLIPPKDDSTATAFPPDRALERIGPYKLLENIGEGGMGVVYLAEQEAPLRRRVALKVIKPGMDSKQVLARFEAERQALAMMNHPNIARVFDAGATAQGQPYFVMEHVAGASRRGRFARESTHRWGSCWSTAYSARWLSSASSTGFQ